MIPIPLNLFMLGALAAVATPIIVHIAHSRKVRRMDWGAMRFLFEMLHKSKRRFFLDHWLLMATRMGIFLFLALALMRPAFRPDEDDLRGDGVKRYGRVAAVILFDDSLGTGAGRSSKRIEGMKELARTYLDTLPVGSEVSLLRLSELGRTETDPLFDLEAARAMIDAIEPTDAASDVPALLEAGLVQLTRHLNPTREIVLVSDGAAEGWRPGERGRWAELRRKLAPRPEAEEAERVGISRRLLVLAPPWPEDRETINWAVTELQPDRTLVVRDRPTSFRVRLERIGEARAGTLTLRFLVDGRVVEERTVEPSPEAATTVRFRHLFEEPGDHVVEAVLTGARDALPADDRRARSLRVMESMPVLLVEGEPGKGLDGSLGLLALALDPRGDEGGFFKLDRAGVGEVERVDSGDYGVVVLGGVPALDPEAITALERFVVNGGGLLVVLGPGTDPEQANRFWARRGDGFLPAPIETMHTAEERLRPIRAARGHPAFAAFSGKAAESWRDGRVARYARLDEGMIDPGELRPLLVLEDGHPLLVERKRGEGRVILMTSGIDPAWSEIAGEPFFVPMARGLVAYLGSRGRSPRTLLTGMRIIHPRAGGEESEPPLVRGPFPGMPADGILGDEPARAAVAGGPGTPGGAGMAVTSRGEAAADGTARPASEAIPMTAGRWEGKPVYLSEPLAKAGIYLLTERGDGEGATKLDGGAAAPARYVVAHDPRESRLEPLPEGERTRILAGTRPVWLTRTAAVRRALDASARQGVEIWYYLLAASVGCLFLESYLTRRQATLEGRS